MQRVLALLDVSYSNSMIDAWWRSLRHRRLYLHHLNSIATIRRLTAFCVHQHNTVMPHAAFDGQTPDEMYFAQGERVPDELRARGLDARRRRLEENRRTEYQPLGKKALDLPQLIRFGLQRMRAPSAEALSEALSWDRYFENCRVRNRGRVPAVLDSFTAPSTLHASRRRPQRGRLASCRRRLRVGQPTDVIHE